MKTVTICSAILALSIASFAQASKIIVISNNSGEDVRFYISSKGDACGSGGGFGLPNQSSQSFPISNKTLAGCKHPTLTLLSNNNVNASSASIKSHNQYSCVVNPGPTLGCEVTKNEEY